MLFGHLRIKSTSCASLVCSNERDAIHTYIHTALGSVEPQTTKKHSKYACQQTQGSIVPL